MILTPNMLGAFINLTRLHSQVEVVLSILSNETKHDLLSSLKEAVERSRDNMIVQWVGFQTDVADGCVVLESTLSDDIVSQLFAMPTDDHLLVFFTRVYTKGDLSIDPDTVCDAQNALHDMYLDFGL